MYMRLSHATIYFTGLFRFEIFYSKNYRKCNDKKVINNSDFF